MIDEWTFYAVTIPAVILVGFSKGGFGGALAIIGVPIMALVMPPFQAAAILLPVLLVMDAASLWSWRGWYDKATLKLMVPSASVGIGLGWAIASFINDDGVRLVVGIIALGFVLRYWHLKLSTNEEDIKPKKHNAIKAHFWGSISGFTSFVAHAGGAPYQVYTLPLKQDPRVYTGTSVIFFACVNAIKVVPYFVLGQFETSNLIASLIMIPLAIISTFIGAALVKKMKPSVFYPLMYSFVTLVALKLVWDGLSGLV